MTDDPHRCRLYLVSPPAMGEGFADTLRAALDGGDVGAFQLRLKDAEQGTIRRMARMLQPVCAERGVAFILNDDAELAAELRLDGVHLGQDDMPIARARTLLGPDAVIGVSCHDSAHLAMEAGEAGADYVAFGAFHPTTSKSPEKLARYGVPGLELVQSWAAHTVVPCVAIGGMTPENCGPLVEAGADFIAAITAVWAHPQGPGAAVAAFNAAIAAAQERGVA